MKKKNLLLMLLAVMTLLLIPVSVQAAAAKPGTVKLSSIKAVDYNQINIKWKKTSGATNYIVYYREAGSSKWVKVKTLDSTKSSYTHTASSKYPIIVGQKYTYTVKAYNKKTKKYGSYNTKGLTVTASLKMVTGIEAKIEGTTVKLTWNKVSGADKYAIYSKIKAGDKWNKIITIKDTSSFIDVNPCVDCTNYYSVRGYSSSTKTYGVMNKTGVSIYVKDSDEVRPTITPEPTDTPDPDDEVDHATPEQKAQEVFKLVNTERMKAGLQPYKYDLRLEKAAMIRAKEIAVKFSHTRPDGRDSYSAVYEAGVGCPSGENIGMGTTSAEYMMRLWMNSTVIRPQFYQEAQLILELDITQGIGFSFFHMGLMKNVHLQLMQMEEPLKMGHLSNHSNSRLNNHTSVFTIHFLHQVVMAINLMVGSQLMERNIIM